jgi:5-oxopent-3-ene-1,2,5-tricarboxylate decarboxylase/2-hydroxyhepta-2,4-diene-1,7-dioate isomerase
MALISAWQPGGTVYGTLLNFQCEFDLWAARMVQAPYQAPPKAPVLYVKTANTFNPLDAVLLQDGVTELDVGATLGLVMGDHNQAVSAVLLLDWSVPHGSYYRPPSKFRCRDGYLGLGQPVPWTALDCGSLQISVRLNGQQVQVVDLSTLVRPAKQLVADVAQCMALRAGDVLMVGTDCLADGQRVRAKAGDSVQIDAPGLPSVAQRLRGAAAGNLQDEGGRA